MKFSLIAVVATLAAGVAANRHSNCLCANHVATRFLEYNRNATLQMCEAYRAADANLLRRNKPGSSPGGVGPEKEQPAKPNPGETTTLKTDTIPKIDPEVKGPDGSGILPGPIGPEVIGPDGSNTGLLPGDPASTVPVPEPTPINRPGSACPDCTVEADIVCRSDGRYMGGVEVNAFCLQFGATHSKCD
ncbi:hypothetical protein LZ554_008939 [Drepanopeziza brunnea f. sp. 'monogermtubi']|nr:hypothetical protein LZ554_008939 [Drepanopeziza brunnea f. sp. 'monogermtubi']